MHSRCSICRGVGGLTPLPSGASQPPKFLLTPTGLVKNTLKYIADPLLVLPQIEYCVSTIIAFQIFVKYYRFHMEVDLIEQVSTP